MAKKQAGYEISGADIESTLRYLKTEGGKPNATREDAIEYLENMQTTAHIAAHKVVKDIMSGKLKTKKKTQNTRKN